MGCAKSKNSRKVSPVENANLNTLEVDETTSHGNVIAAKSNATARREDVDDDIFRLCSGADIKVGGEGPFFGDPSSSKAFLEEENGNRDKKEEDINRSSSGATPSLNETDPPGILSDANPLTSPALFFPRTPVVELHAIKGKSVDDIRFEFDRYIVRANEHLRKCVGHGEWTDLNMELLKDSNREGAKEGPLQWWWIKKVTRHNYHTGVEVEGVDSTSLAKSSPLLCMTDNSGTSCDWQSADGLLCFRVLRMSLVQAVIIHHLSLVTDNWRGSNIDGTSDLSLSLSFSLADITQFLLAKLAVQSVRITLNYYQQEGNIIGCDKEMLHIIKNDLKYKWFQLCNSDGRRAQILSRKRGVQCWDSKEPAEDDPILKKSSVLAECPVDCTHDSDEES